MTSYNFLSVFAEELTGYLNLLNKTNRSAVKIGYDLKSLDAFLFENGVVHKTLTEDAVQIWLNRQTIKVKTKAQKLGHIRGFGKYLRSLGYEVSLPETPIIPYDYVPYLFSEEELSRIFAAADNPLPDSHRCYSVLEFPVLLRVLYSCGLRLGEALSLKWEDIDLTDGIIKVLKGKNQKQRNVPIHESLRTLLDNYQKASLTVGMRGKYVFESKEKPDRPYCDEQFRYWFSRVMQTAGITYVRKEPKERGPCPHCLRHLFVIRSFIQSEVSGRSFEDTVPVLSIYLGHKSLMETEKYLRADYIMYTQSHKRVNAYLDAIFPEVIFE